MMAAQIKQIL